MAFMCRQKEKHE